MRLALATVAAFMAACASAPGFPAGEPAPLTVTGEVVRHAGVASREDILPRHVDVWLPPSYRTSSERYPVVYVQDGNVIFDPALSTVSGVEWGMDETMTRLVGEDRVREAIVVGIHSTRERYEDYMPEAAIRPLDEDMRRRLAKRPRPFDIERMHGDTYQRFVADELKPAIDRIYRTRPGREDTFVLGASTGGLAAVYAAISRPDIYGAAAGMSSHMGSAEGAVVDWIEANPPDPARTRLYLDYGDQGVDAEWEYPAYHARLDAALKTAGYADGERYVNRLYPGTGHGESFWAARLEQPLVFLLGRDDE